MFSETAFYLIVPIATIFPYTGAFKDCDQVRKAGNTKTGVYTLWKDDNTSFKVYCEHEGGISLTLIQRRMKGNFDFVQPWSKYQFGFGNLDGDYWAGLNQIFYLTYTGNNVLKITMQDWNNNNRIVRYSDFRLKDSTDYTMSIGGFSGNVPDDLSYNNNMKFATFDKPDINRCALSQHAGWWYNDCSYALLNGKYYHGGHYAQVGPMYDGIYWKDWMGYNCSLKYVSMTLSKF